MFKYNLPFETINGLTSNRQIVRIINEDIDGGTLLVYYDNVNNQIPDNLAKILRDINRTAGYKITIQKVCFTDTNKLDVEAIKNAAGLLICGYWKLIMTVNALDLELNIPIIFVELETTKFNSMCNIYLEDKKFKYSKIHKTIVKDNSFTEFHHEDFNGFDTAWMFTLSLLNLAYNHNLNPILRSNYAACIDFLSYFLTLENVENHNAKKQLIILKKGITCFFNAFNNDIESHINSKFLKYCNNWFEYRDVCGFYLTKVFNTAKLEPFFIEQIQKYNIKMADLEVAYYYYKNCIKHLGKEEKLLIDFEKVVDPKEGK